MDRLKTIFNEQLQLQKKISNTDCDKPDYKAVYNNATAAMVEIGEMLQADTRWKPEVTKSRKTPVYNEEEFLEEWSDAFIYMLNVLIYYGASITDAIYSVENKISINKERFNEH